MPLGKPLDASSGHRDALSVSRGEPAVRGLFKCMIFFLQGENGFHKGNTYLQENIQIMQKNKQKGVEVTSRPTT